MGDGLNQTLWLFDPKKNSKILKKILANANCDLARIYKMVTLILNMKPDEHEFKVMGMAPYGKKKYYLKIYKNIFKNIIKFKGLKIVENKRPKDLFIFLKESLKYERFDNIAAACQYFLEKIVNELCFRIYKKYKIKNFYFGGGISMNVKMYKDLASKKYINKIVNSPSGSDESLSLGACYYLNRNNNNKIVKDLYLGRKLIQDSKKLYEIAKSKFNKKDFKIINNVKSNYIAQLLKKDEIIAIANGREEFGARALGSRSIIANPSNFENIRKINEYIKSRDFWMPFALSILDEEKNTLLLNVNSLNSSYMNLSFDTKKKYNEKIKAGCHPYDKTVRPQFVKKSQNINYYSIIKNFNKITKIPALLNTSLNLHGSPKCSDLLDVIYTFKNSGLNYLYLENNLLIKKIKIEQLRKETS